MTNLNNTDETEPNGPTIVYPGAAESESADAVLSDIEPVETIADRVDLDRIADELPAGWTVKPDLVMTEEEPLAETLLFVGSPVEPRLALRPADPARPGEDIEFYERPDPRTTEKRTMTVDRLPEAIRVAVNRIHQFDA